MKTRRRGSTFTWMLACLFLLAVIACGVVYYRFALAPASPESTEIIVDVPPGATLASVKKNLEIQGLRVDSLSFRVWTRLSRASGKLHAGEFKIRKDMPARNILREILYGRPVQYHLTIPEGWNIYDIAAELDKYKGYFVEQKSFLQMIRENPFFKQVGAPPTARDLEGFLFPETYSFHKYDSLEKLIGSMLSQFETHALPILKQHPWGKTSEGRYKLLTLASIVQKESWLPDEQPLVASVFWNRLNKRMRLQSDPTIIYGLMPNYNGNIRKQDILNYTPYNTYRIDALPPGPIANPSVGALRATVHPAQSEFLFFVANGEGRHAFSKDYKTHSKSVGEYLRKVKSSSR